MRNGGLKSWSPDDGVNTTMGSVVPVIISESFVLHLLNDRRWKRGSLGSRSTVKEPETDGCHERTSTETDGVS